MIAIITHNYPSNDNPVAGLFVQDHEKIIRQETGQETRVFYYPFGEYPMTKSIRNPLKWSKFAAYFMRTSRRIKKDITNWTQKNPDKECKIIAHWFFPNGTFALKHFNNVHVICHGTDLYQLRKFPIIASFFTGRAKKVKSWQCVSTDLKRILLELYPFIDESIILVKPMPIGPMFSNERNERDKKLVVSVGALIKRKNFDRLISEIAKLPDIKLEIFGDGPEKPNLFKQINEFGLSNRVRLAGQVTREDLAKIYNRAALFVMLSDDEGFGLVLKEAQACGCKTLAYLGDGMADTKPDYTVSRDEDVAERINIALSDLS